MLGCYFLIILSAFTLISDVESVSVCSSSSIVSVVTDPVCTGWCKVRLCSSGQCRSVNGGAPECQCESCTFGNWFSSSSDSTTAYPDSQYNQNGGYNSGTAAGSAGVASTQGSYGNSQYDSRYNNNNGYNSNYGYNNQRSSDYGNSGYTNGYNPSRQSTNGYGYGSSYTNNQYDSNVPNGYGSANQNRISSGYQNFNKKR